MPGLEELEVKRMGDAWYPCVLSQNAPSAPMLLPLYSLTPKHTAQCLKTSLTPFS